VIITHIQSKGGFKYKAWASPLQPVQQLLVHCFGVCGRQRDLAETLAALYQSSHSLYTGLDRMPQWLQPYAVVRCALIEGCKAMLAAAGNIAMHVLCHGAHMLRPACDANPLLPAGCIHMSQEKLLYRLNRWCCGTPALPLRGCPASRRWQISLSQAPLSVCTLEVSHVQQSAFIHTWWGSQLVRSWYEV